jgi:acyl-[acyl carrier protein]--UDP-N-acetylglucosamine O-acyltransferase
MGGAALRRRQFRDRADHRGTLHYRLTRINQGTEEVKLVRQLYRQFYLQEKSYLQIAGAFETVAQAIEKGPRLASLVTFAKTMCPGQAEETSSP